MRTFWWGVIVSILLFLTTALFYLVPPLNDASNSAFLLASIILTQLILIFSALLILYGWLGMEKGWPGRLGWLFVFLSTISTMIGTVIWVGLEQELTFPSIADFFLILFYVFMILAMVRFRKIGSVRFKLKEILIGILVSVALASLLLIFIVLPFLLDKTLPLGERLFGSLYMLAHLAMLCFGVFILIQFWGGRMSVTYILFLAGLLITAVADILFIILEPAIVKNPLDLAYTAGYLLLGLAALHERSLHVQLRKELVR